MSKWSGQTKGKPLGYRIFIFILKYINIRVAYFIAWFVALYYFFFTEKSAIKNFYRSAFRFEKSKLRFAVFYNFYMLAKVMLDRVVLLAGFKGKYTFDFEGEENLHKMALSGKGGVILGAHAGNWEVAGKLLKRLKTPVHIVMYDGERSEIKDLLEETTGGKAFNVVYIKNNDLSHIYLIHEIIRRGELIAMHGDRFLPGNKYHLCSFFGKEAPLPLGPYYLAASLKVPVCFVSTMKETASHYHFHSTEPMLVGGVNASRKTLHADVKQMAEYYAQNLENIVKRYPHQWFNYYDFWDKTELNIKPLQQES
jgi:predicted LPLAT superfamily acyltransferase